MMLKLRDCDEIKLSISLSMNVQIRMNDAWTAIDLELVKMCYEDDDMC